MKRLKIKLLRIVLIETLIIVSIFGLISGILAGGFTANNLTHDSSHESQERAIPVAYDFLSRVMGFSIRDEDIKNVSILSVPDISNNSEQDCECVDIRLINNTRLSMLVRVGGGIPTFDDVVHYSIWTNGTRLSVDVNATLQAFLQRLIENSINYVTVYERVLEVVEEVGAYVGVEAWYTDIVYTVTSTAGRLEFMWSKAIDAVPSSRQTYWIGNNVELSIDPQVGIVAFGNTWDKYEMVNNEIMITSSEEAISIAVDNLDEERRELVNATKAELMYYPGEGRNPSSLYPCWRIEIDYSEILPSNITNHITYMWADTEHIWYSSDQGFYGYTSYTMASPYDVDPDEIALQINASQHIHSVLQNILYADQNITTSSVQDITESADSDAIFFVGHGGKTWVWTPPWFEDHYYVVDSDGQYAYDEYIHSSYTGDPNFVFFWSCKPAEEIGGLYGWPFWRAHGMPFAYSNRDDLSSDGYHDPDYEEFAFLGFKKDAPWLVKDIEGVVDAGYHFVIEFYDALGSATHPHVSINTALDLASNQIWGKNWDLCPLYQLHEQSGVEWGEMRLYGDGTWTIILPGDVDHDADVDVVDATLVNLAYGTIIGDPDYNPDADLNGDGIVDIADLTIVCYNLGKST